MTSSQRVGALEVLRVALMRGDLDDVRNQMARALALGRHRAEALESLLGGLEGIGIDLSGARASLGGGPQGNAREGCLAGGTRVWRDVGSAEGQAEGQVCAPRRVWEPSVAVDQGKDVVMSRLGRDRCGAMLHPSKENVASAALPKGPRTKADGKRPRRKRSRGHRTSQEGSR